MSEAKLVSKGGVEIPVSELLTLRQAGEKVGLARQTMHHHAVKGNIPFVEIGGIRFTTLGAVLCYTEKKVEKKIVSLLKDANQDILFYILSELENKLGAEKQDD